ncbi:MAG: transporter substrate-binding domain-containing protein [Erysipelotrichaceae bacterium]|nr:transporter substrate-binding domain-containing protein [Erysipelotrichaceae bacterium]
MKKVLCIFAAALLLLSGCANNTPAADETEDNVFTVGMEVNYAPFNYELASPTDTSVQISGGYADGYDVMIAKNIADQLGMELEIKKIAWNGLGLALESGEIDAIIAGMTANEEREAGIDFTTPYYDSHGMIIIVRKGSEVESFTNIQQFAGYTVVGQLNTSYDEVIDQINGVIHATPKTAYPEMIVALQQGEVDGITAEMAVAVGILASNSDLTVVHFDEGKGFDVDTTVSIGLSEGSRGTDFFNKVQAALDNISEEARENYMVDSIAKQPAEN